MKKNIFLKFIEDVDKNEIVKKFLFYIGREVLGFYKEPIVHKSQIVGYHVFSTSSEETALLGHRDINEIELTANPARVDDFYVDQQQFIAFINHEITSRTKENYPPMVFFEIGKLEIISPEFRYFVQNVLDDPQRVAVGTIDYNALQEPFVKEIEERKDIKVITINKENKDKIVKEVLEVLDETLKNIQNTSGH